ncbi:MAG: DUF3089 domain-containing protein [Bacteroidetes bacterium]|nr:DUF3089 domain-containing protein [Bacteroidota bacterium]
MQKSIFIISVQLIVFLCACRPFRGFEWVRHPLVPDYAEEKNWIALPWKRDIADSVPSGCDIKENQKEAVADVFYIHPTMFLRGNNWNGDVTNNKLNKKSELSVLHQATVFNAAGRVFVPRYRQAVLKAFFNKKNGPKALDLAYEDVKSAFEYYLKNWNKGRPIIIVGHSQGAHHAVKLLKEFFDGKDLQKKLIVAYPIGIPFKKDELKNIPVSDNEKQTGCFVTWNTFKWNTNSKLQKRNYRDVPCVNPLTMKSNEEYADASLNKGGITLKFAVNPHPCDAMVHGNFLWIHKPAQRGYYRIGRSYHLADINLFYMNLRTNALLRVEEYWKNNK